MDLMAAGLSFRAISELIKNNNLQGLKLFLDSRHANIEDRDEVGTRICFFAKLLNRFTAVCKKSTKPKTLLMLCKIWLDI